MENPYIQALRLCFSHLASFYVFCFVFCFFDAGFARELVRHCGSGEASFAAVLRAGAAFENCAKIETERWKPTEAI